MKILVIGRGARKHTLFILVMALIIASLTLGSCTPKSTTPPPSSTTAPSTPSITITTAQTTTQTTTPIPTKTTKPAPTKTKPPTSTSTSSDTIAPPDITGLLANNAYDGKVNLWWDKTSAEDFDHYAIYCGKEPADASQELKLSLIQVSNNISLCNYQIAGLENGGKYSFGVTAVDKNGNAGNLSSVLATPTAMPSGTVDPVIKADVYLPDKAWAGTTLLVDNHDRTTSRIIEVNMRGEIIWQYQIPASLKTYTNPGFDAELLENNNILYVLPGMGIFEIDRAGKAVWSYLTVKVSHDADRLPNGNTIFAFGNNDQKTDAQVTEVDPSGKIVWQWFAKDYYDKAPYNTISNEGWTHTNAVTRLANGNTLISPRNFNVVVEVNPAGVPVAIYGDGVFVTQHDPVLLSNGNLLVANQGHPHQALELNISTGEVVWKSLPADVTNIPVRDADRLPNGNTLVTGSTRIYEVTPKNEIVWELILNGISLSGADSASYGFYKTQRLNK
jgi:hypothetical protein